MADTTPTTHRCGACNSDLDRSAFHRDRTKATGLSSTCKECAIARARKWYADNHERGKSTRHKYYVEHRDEILEGYRRERRENPEVVRARELAARHRNWTPDRSKQKSAWDKAWHRRNPAKVKAYQIVCSARRRAITKGTRVPAAVIEEIGASQRWRCGVCACSIRKGYHLDHIMPLARGGGHVRANLQLLCQPCNNRKSWKDPIDFMRQMGRLL